MNEPQHEMTNVLPSRFEPGHLLSEVGDDHEAMTILLEIFIATSPDMLLDLAEAVEDGSTTRIREIAHSFKGSTGALGASFATALLHRLEEHACRGDQAACTELFSSARSSLLSLIDDVRSFVQMECRR
ncbi:Hpt domain-containing protein [Noviherbaspirillum galbum]|uniref:Hpt domain-containing protein n=1 Tax=Noviherbaspirillum galbum TaxID=2709383 RepID=A0A6B3SNM6_9BURK|nr:Hpt domain-containing protein [Noviherbaspirillum galbum]NEX62331.1 Hpt domain-containing protein [Noviherbaspirillum galbum]